MSVAGAPLVTIAHQDDIYKPDYAEQVLKEADRASDPVIIFTDYSEKRGEEEVTTNKLLRIKRFLLLPLRPRIFRKSRFIRRRVLSMGSPICCPAVTYVMGKMPERLFDESYKVSLDWACWEKLSKLKGSFVYVPKRLMMHRIHEESETTRQIGNSGRSREDLEMFRKFWPAPIAGMIAHFYRDSESSNVV